ncbi:MAG: IMP cyclohydrolase [Ruthenibacterium lactatiformans]
MKNVYEAPWRSCGNTYTPAAASCWADVRRHGRAVIAYFIMGRSVNSRNRVFAKDGGIRTEAFDPSKWRIPSLIIYAPGARAGENTHRDQRRPDGHDRTTSWPRARPLPRRCAPAPSSRTPQLHPPHQRHCGPRTARASPTSCPS